MDPNPLVAELIEAGARFLDEFEKSFPVAAAFWLKESDEERPYLHIASYQMPPEKIGEAYGQVLRIARQLKGVHFDPFNIKLRKIEDPIVQFALKFQHEHSAPISTIFNVPTFEGVEVEGMYLYPPMKTAA